MEYPEDYINKIICGNCLEVMENIPDNSIDLIIADPPYFKLLKKDYDNKYKNENEFIVFQKKWIKESLRLLKLTGSIYIFGSIKNNCLIKLKLWLDKIVNFRNWITWEKLDRRVNTGKYNWRNVREEILYYTKTDKYYFEK